MQPQNSVLKHEINCSQNKSIAGFVLNEPVQAQTLWNSTCSYNNADFPFIDINVWLPPFQFLSPHSNLRLIPQRMIQSWWSESVNKSKSRLRMRSGETTELFTYILTEFLRFPYFHFQSKLSFECGCSLVKLSLCCPQKYEIQGFEYSTSVTV